MTIKEEHLKSIFSSKSPLDLTLFVRSLNKYLPIYKINTPHRIAAFLAQIAHETGNFKWLTELGRKSYFAKYEPGTRIGRKLGNTHPGDGYKFRGRGMIQLTGRFNYTRFNNHLKNNSSLPQVNVLAKPEKVSNLPLAILAAAFYWKDNNLNKYADNKDFRTLTKRINGGLNGYRDRKLKYNSLKIKLGI